MCQTLNEESREVNEMVMRQIGGVVIRIIVAGVLVEPDFDWITK